MCKEILAYIQNVSENTKVHKTTAYKITDLFF